MNPEELYKKTISNRILEEGSENGEITLSDEFDEKRLEILEDFTDSEVEDMIDYLGFGEERIHNVDQHKQADLLIDAITIAEAYDDFSREEAFRIAHSLDIFNNYESRYVPEPFLLLKPSEIESFFNEFETSILLFFRHDCDPCKRVCEDLEALYDASKIPTEMGLGAVRGSDNPRLISNEYDVTVAPTLLFCSSNRIESRLIGAAPKSGIGSEIEKLKRC